MIEKFLVQHASGPCAVLLELSKPWHVSYAKKHDFKYVDDHTEVSTGKFSRSSESMVWLASCLNVFPDGAFLAVLDADTLIVKPEVDLRAGLSKGYELAFLGGNTWANMGVVFLLNTAAVRDFFRRILERGSVGTTNWLDATCREVLQEMPMNFCFLDDRWNFFPTYGEAHRQHYYTEEEAIIRAWHGWGAKKALREMTEVLEKLTA